MRAVVVAALGIVLVGCAPPDPMTYAQMECVDQDEGLLPGSAEYAACVQFVAKNPPTALLALGGATLEPLRAAPDRQVN